MAAEIIDVGVIGFGFAGKTFHAPVIAGVSGLRLAAILQRNGDDAALAYSEARQVRSLEELLAQPSISLVVIATPNESHFSLAKQCLLAGREVVIDKPFATTYADAAELAALAADQGRLLSVYQNRRWDGDFKALQRLVSSGTLGRIVTYEAHFDRFRPQPRTGAWRERAAPGAGVLFDLGPHLIDQALVLFGLPLAVGADVRVERDGASVNDAFDVILHYPTMRAILRATMLASSPGPHFTVHGTVASFVKNGLDPQEDALKRGLRPGDAAGWGEEPVSAWGTLTLGNVDPSEQRGIPMQAAQERKIPSDAGDYRGYYENVRDAILGKAPLAVTPQSALHVMRILELAVLSSQQRRVLDFAA